MTYTGTVGTALKLDDKDVNDPNSGFYTAQATTEQINNIPTDAKEAGELLYNKTTGKLVLYNGIADGWETVNSSDGFNGNIVINNYPAAPTDPVEGEIYYNTTTNTYQVYTDGEWQDITTSDTELVAKSHATDPSPLVKGLIYYNTTDNTLRAYLQNKWTYLSPKPYISASAILVTNTLTVSLTPQILNLIDVTLGSSFAYTRSSNNILYHGIGDTHAFITISLSGHCSADTTFTLAAYSIVGSNDLGINSVYNDVTANKNFTIILTCYAYFDQYGSGFNIKLSSTSTCTLTINKYTINVLST